MKIEIAREEEHGSVSITIEYKPEYVRSLIRELWDQVSAQADRLLTSLEAEEEK